MHKTLALREGNYFLLGVEHIRSRPSALKPSEQQLLTVINQTLHTFKPKKVILEAPVGLQIHNGQFRESVPQHLRQTFAHLLKAESVNLGPKEQANEMIYALTIASKIAKTIVCPEPSRRNQVDWLIQKGFSLKDLYTFFMLRNMDYAKGLFEATHQRSAKSVTEVMESPSVIGFWKGQKNWILSALKPKELTSLKIEMGEALSLKACLSHAEAIYDGPGGLDFLKTDEKQQSFVHRYFRPYHPKAYPGPYNCVFNRLSGYLDSLRDRAILNEVKKTPIRRKVAYDLWHRACNKTPTTVRSQSTKINLTL